MWKTIPYPTVDTLPAALTESEERLRLAAEAADLFAWELDLEKNTLKWSHNAARVLNCAADQLTSDPAQRDFFINIDDRLEVLNAYENAKAAGSDKFDASFRGLDGDIDHAFWRMYGRIIYDEKGVATRVVAATQNITFQKNAEEELRLLAQRLATAEEAAGTLIYDWNLKTGEVWRSAGIERVLGWTAQEMGTSMAKWAELLHPADAPRMKAMAQADFTSFNDNFVVEYRLRHKLGHYVWLLDSGRVYRDAQGNVFRVAGALVDISSRKCAEASSNRQAAMINLSFEPIFVWHPERGIVEWNQGAQQLYGYTREEAIGQPSDTLLQTIRPITQEKLLEILKTENSWQAELQRNAKGGRQLIVESRYQLIDVDGDILILETDHDISERKRAETYTARMAAVALASHDALFGITPQGYIETWNPAAQRVFGYSANEAIGQHVRILALPALREEQSKIMQQAQDSETVGPYEARRLRKDGSPIDVSVAIAPVKASDGSLLSLSVAVHDISDRKEWEARQWLMNRELAHRNKNSFAVLQGILRSTLRHSVNPQDFADAFSGRLHSLASAQDMLTASDWRGVELGALLRHQLAAYAMHDDTRLVISGPQVNLPPEYAVPFSLIFNELATNAVKFGALSVPTGSIQIYWRTERPSREKLVLFLTWRERGGPLVVSPAKLGFGLTLIQKSIADAKIENEFAPDGLTCKIELTLKTARTSKFRPKSSISSLRSH